MSDVDKLMTEILGERPNVKDEALRELVMARMKAGGAVLMKRGGKAKGETLASMDTGKVEIGRAPGAEKAERILAGAAEFIPGVAAGKSALEGEYQKALIEAGLDVAGGSLAKGLGAAIPAVAGIFIGPKSKLWDKTAAKEFAKLEKAGASPQEAWQQTGTFRSPDGILRQEISDQPSRLRRERMMDLEEEHQSIRAKGNEEHKRLLDAVDRGEMTKEAAEAEWERIREPLLDQRAQIALEKYPAASKLAKPGQLIRRQNPNLSQTLYHPELFKAYPQLKHIRTEYRVDPSAMPRGHLTVGEPLPWSSSNAPSMFSVAPTTPEARNIILHEAQHGIQRLENMGLGGNPTREWNMLPSEMHPIDYLQRLQQSRDGLLRQLDDLAKQVPEGGFDLKSDEMHPLFIRNGALTRRIENTEDAILAVKQGEYHPLYQRMAGEAEARAVQKRMTYGPEYRREIFPLDEYDVPIDQLVVRTEPYAKGGAVQAAPYGLRETSGMPKGKGYFGELPTAGGVMTELSASDDAGEFPLIVPTLTRKELEHLQSGGEPTEEIYAKAKAWAESRKGQGRDPFATSEDLRMPMPEYGKGGPVKMAGGGDPEEELKRLTPFYGAKPAPVDTEEEDAKRRLRELEGRVLKRDYIEPQKDDLGGMVRRGLRSGLGKVMSPEGSKRSADILTDVASFVAPLMWGYESGQALGRGYTAARRGDYGEAALEGGLGVLGVLPAVPGASVAARGAERAANIGSTAIRRPFTPATITVEATAPDLGQLSTIGFRQGLNDRLLRQLSAGRKAREGQGVFSSDITNTLETNPMLAIDVPRAGKIGEGRGSNEALRREIAQAGINLNQESMGAHRFIPLLTNRPEDASAMLIKSKGGLSNEEVIKLGERLGNDMVVAHNPRLGGVVIYPYGTVVKGGAPEFAVAKKTAEEILGKKGKIQYGVADYDKDRLYMKRSPGDYQRAGAQPMSAEQADLRQKLQGLEKFMFTDDPKGVPGNIQGAPLGGLQPWSRGKAYPTHIQGIGDDWRAINYLTEETGARRPTLQQAEEDRAALLDKWHRVLPGKVR